MKTNTSTEKQAIELWSKIIQKKKELKQLKKRYNDVFYAIVGSWKEDVKNKFPQLEPCDIGEYVGVNVTLKGIVYNIFISEDRQKMYCMFCLDRKNKDRREQNIKEIMDQADFEKLKQIFDSYLKENKAIAYEYAQGMFVKFKMEQLNAAYEFFLNIVRAFA